ncbi:MAG TPA: sigma-54 dependent transcriptional regulator [Candidatus Acidoferrum sp.]|nr:sigma-54 dependent transcriptional regulator [Candidatus Acidoferrum sp.]
MNWIETGTTRRYLVASSDPLVRRRVLRAPEFAGRQGVEACGGAAVLAKLREVACDGVMLDRNLADLDAAEVAAMIQREHPDVEVLWIGGEQEVAGDSGEPEEENLNGAKAQIVEWRAEREAPARETLPGMIGTSAAMQEVYRLTRLVAKRETTVLITGETGTGKELVAEAVHKLSPRAKQPFVVVNCAAIPEPLLEAELFGHARGAFTGAVQSRLGKIHAAQGGSLFLDEIGELPLGMQAKLLRFLQSGEVQRLGSADLHRVDVRVICATNVNLGALVEAKHFRMDLYYRLEVFPIELPPLQSREGDIEKLAEHFLGGLSSESGMRGKRLSEEALAELRRRAWPGNVRELQHALERAFILSGEEEELTGQHFPRAAMEMNGRQTGRVQ